MRYVLVTVMSLCVVVAGCAKGDRTEGPVSVGSKNFTESVILGELLAQTLENAGCEVDRNLNMGGTFVADRALRTGALDAYVEYSGTALTAILDHEPMSNRDSLRQIVRSEYESEGIVWGPELGFENTFAMIVRGEAAEEHELKTISDLQRVEDLFQPGFGYEFVERQDGWQGLLDAYRLKFVKPPRTMDLGLTYKAVDAGEVDLIAGNSTDGLIEHLGLVVLADDKDYFPPYDAAIVYRKDIEAACPAAIEAFERLRGTIDEATMRRLNYAVDGEHRDVGEVVREFLDSRQSSVDSRRMGAIESLSRWVVESWRSLVVGH